MDSQVQNAEKALRTALETKDVKKRIRILDAALSRFLTQDGSKTARFNLLNARAQAYLESGRSVSALADAKKMNEIIRGHHAAMEMLGRIYETSDKLKAAKAFRLAVKHLQAQSGAESDGRVERRLQRLKQRIDALSWKDPFVCLPEELCLEIVGYLSTRALLRNMRVSRRWHELCSSPAVWRRQIITGNNRLKKDIPAFDARSVTRYFASTIRCIDRAQGTLKEFFYQTYNDGARDDLPKVILHLAKTNGNTLRKLHIYQDDRPPKFLHRQNMDGSNAAEDVMTAYTTMSTSLLSGLHALRDLKYQGPIFGTARGNVLPANLEVLSLSHVGQCPLQMVPESRLFPYSFAAASNLKTIQIKGYGERPVAVRTLESLLACAPLLRSFRAESISIPKGRSRGWIEFSFLEELWIKDCTMNFYGPLPPSLRKLKAHLNFVPSEKAQTSGWVMSNLPYLEDLDLFSFDYDFPHFTLEMLSRKEEAANMCVELEKETKSAYSQLKELTMHFESDQCGVHEAKTAFASILQLRGLALQSLTLSGYDLCNDIISIIADVRPPLRLLRFGEAHSVTGGVIGPILRALQGTLRSISYSTCSKLKEDHHEIAAYCQGYGIEFHEEITKKGDEIPTGEEG